MECTAGTTRGVAAGSADTGLGITGSGVSTGGTFSLPSDAPTAPVDSSSCGKPNQDCLCRDSMDSGARSPPRRRRGACERSSIPLSSSPPAPSVPSDEPLHDGRGNNQSSDVLVAGLGVGMAGMVSIRLDRLNGKNRLGCDDGVLR